MRTIVEVETDEWAFAAGKFFTDPIWWFFLFWLPKFLNQEYGITLSGLGPPLVVIYLVADLGSIGGGWISSALIHRGWSVNAGRKTAMLACALGVVPIVLVVRAPSLWGAVGLISLATAAHQGWSANLFTLVSDTFPRRAVASVVGIGGFAGSVRWYVDRHRDGIPLAVDGQLRSDLLRGRVGLPDRVDGHPRPRPGPPSGAVAGGA